MNPAILDDIAAIKALDSQNMRASLELLHEQMKSIYFEAAQLTIPARYQRAKKIVVCGMGGSTLPAHIIKTVYAGNLAVPFEIVNGYHLPAYVGKDTLVIASSYSGTTEEAISGATEARKRGALL